VLGNPVSYVDPTGEFGIIGAGIGVGVELAIQGYKNYKNGCDVFDIDNYDWWDVGIAGAVGAFAPGMLSVGKTAFKSGAAIRALSGQVGRTANRAAKISGRIKAHEVAIADAVVQQGAYQGTKTVLKDANGDGNCGCRK
jgi:hypothetical protein